VITDYFAQDQYKVLDANARILDDLSNAAPRVTQTELRTLMGCFLFSDDDVFKRLGVLSGGERNRYALARLLLSSSNFLLLDEPTNHLDMRAKDVLLEALKGFTGTVIFVSHDRYFLDAVATRVFEVQDHQIHVYPGNYEDYLWRKQGGPAQSVNALSSGNAHAPRAEKAKAAEHVEVARDEAGNAAKRLNPIKLKQVQERVAALEVEVPHLEAAIAETEAALAVFVSAEQSQRLTEVLGELRAELKARTEEWEQCSRQLEVQPVAQ
jgi:ATP-binding cassette, subfamily F, member 3